MTLVFDKNGNGFFGRVLVQSADKVIMLIGCEVVTVEV